MRERRTKNKTMAERFHMANILPDGNLNTIGLFDVVLYNLESTGNAEPQGIYFDTEDDLSNARRNDEKAP